MTIEIEINGSTAPDARYVANAPSPCRVRETEATPVQVELTSEAYRAGGGEGTFYPSPGLPSQDVLVLDLPGGGQWVDFWMGGKWERPSSEDGDAQIVVVRGGQEIASTRFMVRVRKDADTLTPAERDRFVAAFGTLNDLGAGAFANFRAMHVSSADAEAHGGPQFLPWHRAYLLDLERELQQIDPSVSLPYWRWDRPAPRVFQQTFMGVSDPTGMVEFVDGHPLNAWMTDGSLGIRRTPLFGAGASRAAFPLNDPNLPFDLSPRDQGSTLGLGADYDGFRAMEGNPHGWAHVSFQGFISAIGTAARDPLFFMLHTNVDRLWALWQWVQWLWDPADLAAYVEEQVDGRRLADTMWPWNGVVTPPRPDFAPGGGLAATPTTAAPGAQPSVQSMIDFQGVVNPQSRLGFGYDNVPFERE